MKFSVLTHDKLMEITMRIIAINGSPNGRRGNTAKVTDRFLAGVRKAGANTRVFYLSELKRFESCRADFACWRKPAKGCVITDDLSPVLDELRQADIWVLATPVHVFNISSLLQKFLERNLAFMHPFIEEEDGAYAHPWQNQADRPQGIVLISTCSFPGLSNFAAISRGIRGFTQIGSLPLLAEIFMDRGRLLSVPGGERKCTDFLAAAEKAGEEIVASQTLSSATVQTLQKGPDILPATYLYMINRYWETHQQ